MTRLAVLTDLHYGTTPDPDQSGEHALEFLNRAITLLNTRLQPDILLLGGDLIHDPDAPNAKTLCMELRKALDQLHHPWLAVPGNHDLPPDSFYQVFERPAPAVDVNTLRILPIVDPEAPGWNAERQDADLQAMISLTLDHTGPVAILQHMSLHPPDTQAARFNLTNAETVIQTMHEANIHLSISGHYHPGFTLQKGPIHFIGCRALCEAPHPLTLINLAPNQPPRITEHSLNA